MIALSTSSKVSVTIFYLLSLYRYYDSNLHNHHAFHIQPDFAAMQVISQLDDMMFWLALHGYIGSDMAHGAKQARKIRIHDKDINTVCGIPLRTIILMFIFLVMGGGWGKCHNLSKFFRFEKSKIPNAPFEMPNFLQTKDILYRDSYPVTFLR